MNYPITWLTEIAKDQEEDALKKLILEIHLNHKMYDYPRVKEMLKEQGLLVNHKKYIV